MPKPLFLADVKKHRGLVRKSCIARLAKIFSPDCKYDDAGWFEVGGLKVVVSTDGIVEDVVKHRPFAAGYYSVVVNFNDVNAKGAKPVGYVAVFSSSSMDRLVEMAKGAAEALRKFDVPILKAHTNPDASYEAIDAAVVGVAEKVIPSYTAEAGDELVVAVDLEGSFKESGWVKVFESSMAKPREAMRGLLEAMVEIAREELATASRDISAAGILGTLAMLCEPSGVGAYVDLDLIPRPRGVGLEAWLATYPSFGFVVATRRSKECLEVFRSHGFEAEVVGKALRERKLIVRLGGEDHVFMDLERESVFGLEGRES